VRFLASVLHLVHFHLAVPFFTLSGAGEQSQSVLVARRRAKNARLSMLRALVASCGLKFAAAAASELSAKETALPKVQAREGVAAAARRPKDFAEGAGGEEAAAPRGCSEGAAPKVRAEPPEEAAPKVFLEPLLLLEAAPPNVHFELAADPAPPLKSIVSVRFLLEVMCCSENFLASGMPLMCSRLAAESLEPSALGRQGV
jgi:hypothetical protein